MSLTRDATLSWVVLRLSERECALPVADVVEVLRMVALTPVPESPPWVVGLLNLRGRGVVVTDLKGRLGLAVQEPDLSSVIVVVRSGGREVGLIADEVIDVLDVPVERIERPDALIAGSHLITSVAHLGDRTILAIDLPRLLGDDR
jgi:purine-binding chemotaxis protein CheW